MKELTAERLRGLLRYDPATGVFRWLLSNKMAGRTDRGGYREIRVDGHLYKAHRLAWLHVHGEWPSAPEIDHINGDRADNCIGNLREANQAQNQANRKIGRNNTSGFKGVAWHRSNRRWKAQIHFQGRQLHLGYFDTAEEARDAYEAKAKDIFGEFASAASLAKVRAALGLPASGGTS